MKILCTLTILLPIITHLSIYHAPRTPSKLRFSAQIIWRREWRFLMTHLDQLFCAVLCVLVASVMSSSLQHHGISQARILEWVAISFPKGSSWPVPDRICVFCTGRQILYHCATWEAFLPFLDIFNYLCTLSWCMLEVLHHLGSLVG